jgi:hypothetical protein
MIWAPMWHNVRGEKTWVFIIEKSFWFTKSKDDCDSSQSKEQVNIKRIYEG